MNKQLCQYRRKDCQTTASYHFFIKLNLRKLDKGFICANCKTIIQI